MNILIVIPARMKSVRFPGKPLALLTARDGVTRPLVEWCWRAAKAASETIDVVVATDSAAIAEAVTGFGGKAVLTGEHLRNGTERCAAVLDGMQVQPDLVINLQGDSPLVTPAMITALGARFADPQVQVATPYVVANRTIHDMLLAEWKAGGVGGTCVVTDAQARALYFSKHPIPFGVNEAERLKLHIGLYGYRPAALAAYLRHPPSAAEQAEGLEQLRFLDMGWPVQMVEVALPEGGLWEVNNPPDIGVVEPLLPVEANSGPF